MKLLRLSIPALALSIAACSTAPTATPTAEIPEATRRAATIAAFPTAAPLVSPTPAPTATTIEPTAAPADPTPTPVVAPTLTYEVQKGDTLSTIAAKHSVSVAALQLANGLGEKQDARLGAKLVIPTTKLADDESTYWFIYIVKPGDTLSTIAAKFKVEVTDVLRVNRISDASRVLVDQKLIIPVKTPRVVEAAPNAAAADDSPKLIKFAPTTEPALIPLAPPAATATAAPILLAAAAPAAAAVADNSDADALRAQLLTLYNEQRIAAGLAPLAPSATLQAAAQAHAEDCAARGFGSHTGSDGSSSAVRIARAGFGGSRTGENWAFARTPAGAFNMWFHQETPSGPHRRNIMSAAFTEVGFGIAPLRGGYMFIANLGG